MRRSGRSKTSRLRRSIGIACLSILAWASLQIQTDYVVLTPGPALDVATMISVKDGEAHPRSPLYLTTVYSDMDTTVSKWIQSQLDENTVLLPKREFIPPNFSEQEYARLTAEMMDESKTVAKIAALRQLGYDVSATGEGAVVQRLLPGTMAEGILREGDVVVTAEGRTIQTSTDLVNLVRRQKPGVPVSLTIQRDSQTVEVRVVTKESDTEPGIAVIGILIKTYLFGHNLPVQIDIDSQNIGGPSAGLMFALGIVDAFGKDGLTAGHKVAGTGTISLDGTVGPVGGVAQKVIGAEQAGAEYFLAPGENFEAAQRAAHRIKVVRADTLALVVTFLKTLGPSALQPGHRLSWRLATGNWQPENSSSPQSPVSSSLQSSFLSPLSGAALTD